MIRTLPLVCLFLAACEPSGPTPVETAETAVERMAREVAAGEATVIDVRSRDEWDAGHLKAAKFVPVTTLSDGIEPADVADVPRGRPVYTYCKAGVRAAKAADLLKEAGYDARPLAEGFEDLKAAGLEVE